jgi:aspartyl-tRNA(Asn)/glutamyl-tRNA(Gln) amidotransferase subunit C
MLAFGVPAEFTPDQIAAIAALAHLELNPSERELLARQLGEILAYAEVVQQIDTEGVPPTTSVANRASDRLDEVGPSLDRDEVLAQAPDPALQAGFFKVPKVIG